MSREVMQQALDALQYNVAYDTLSYDYIQEVIETLRAELAKPEPEPVAWMTENVTHPTIGRMLTFAPVEGWHITWNVVPLYRKEDV
jgi:hypothetical protein